MNMRLQMTRSNGGASTPTLKSTSSTPTTPPSPTAAAATAAAATITLRNAQNRATKSYTNNDNAKANSHRENGGAPIFTKNNQSAWKSSKNRGLKRSPITEFVPVASNEVKKTVNEDTSIADDDDVETMSVELRSTSLEYRHGIKNTLRSRSTSAILLDTGSLVLLSPACLSGGQSSSSSTTTSTQTTLYPRPRTLNVHNARQTPTHHTQFFFGEVLNAWRAKARSNVVPDERTQELFHELSFHPSQNQISEMLQTAKKVARKGSGQWNGLTFGPFFVLVADLKRFRTSSFSNAANICDAKYELSSSLHGATSSNNPSSSSSNCKNNTSNTSTSTNATPTSTANSNSSNLRVLNKLDGNHSNCGTELRSTKSFSSVDDTKKKKHSEPVEVFLGGSCNPTTWRADVAIPALRELGISFYNPQVSDWTPDLIELEHRAKEKARVLFFVMDSETRASAGAIEAAHIAGQNCKQLVLVLHPYKPNQTILNEPISEQEYLDLTRNQMMLRELVTRRGLPVLDNIPSGLQRTKEILSGIRHPPSKISSILDVVRGAFDRVNPVNEVLTVVQCQRALLLLGYAESLLNLDNLNKIIINQRESLKLLQTSTKTNKTDEDGDGDSDSTCKQGKVKQTKSSTAEGIDFDLFCVISAYLSVLQQEIHESGCISPIKGTNVPPPPVYFTNAHDDDIYFATAKNISRTSSNASVPSNSSSGTGSATDPNERHNYFEVLSRSRDSGTSSPQPTQLEPLKITATRNAKSTTTTPSPIPQQLGKLKKQPQILLNVESIETTEIITTKTIETNVVNAAGGQQFTTTASLPSTPLVLNATHAPEYQTLTSTEEESDDSNDSVFSSSSSIASVTGHQFAVDPSLLCSYSHTEIRDVYLGGSCALRTTWREKMAVPYLKTKGVSFHLPALHESIQPRQQSNKFGAKTECATGDCALTNNAILNANAASTAPTAGTVVDNVHEQQQERSFVRTRRKCRGTQLQLQEEEELTVAEESWSWSLPPMGVRTNLYNPSLLDSSRVLLFVITNETRSLAPMTLAAHCIGLMYNVVLAVQMLPDDCVLGKEKLTPAAIKDYNRGRSYLIDLAKRQGVPVFNDVQAALDCTVAKIKAHNNRN